MKTNCFACGKLLTGTKHLADTRDDQIVYVGPDCHRKVLEAGEKGYRYPGLGPKLYPMAHELVMRNRTQDIELETTYCAHCQYNHYTNIGKRQCAKCGQDKMKKEATK